MNGFSIFFGVFGGMFAAAMFATCKGSPYNGGHDTDFSVLMGILAGFYIWFPFHYQFKEERTTVLNSDPTVYPVPLKTAFSAVRELLSQANYNVSDKWRIVMADTNTRQIRAQLLFNDIHEVHGMGNLLNVTTKDQILRRFLEVTVRFEERGNDKTQLLVDFTPHVEGDRFYACDKIISDFHRQVESGLGSGTVLGPRDRPQMLAAPPVWLLVMTVIVTVLYFFRVVCGFMGAQ